MKFGDGIIQPAGQTHGSAPTNAIISVIFIMGIMSWYRTYRSQTVADLDIAPVRAAFLKILSSGEFSHAYLLAGPKGTGKTSGARILAKVLNCEKNRKSVTERIQISDIRSQNRSESRKLKSESLALSEPCNTCASCIAITTGSSMSVTEMDAASNRGIDDIRELRERIGLSPPDGIISVFIIDEVHMLTTEAFNALLKVLEEPPAHVVFILATTDAQKIPATIISRATLIQYRKATPEELQARLTKIATIEKIEIAPESLMRIAIAADGSFRDGVKVFEQLASGEKHIDEAAVNLALGGNIHRLAADLLTGLLKKDATVVARCFAQITDQGMDGVAFTREVLTLAHGKLVEFAGSSDPRLSQLVGLLQAIVVPIEPNLPLPWLPFEIACVGYAMQGKEARSKNQEAKIEEAQDEVTSKHLPADASRPAMQAGHVAHTEEVVAKTSRSGDQEISVSFETIQSQWPLVLAKIKARSVPLEGLLRAIRLIGTDGVKIQLEASYQFHKEQIELHRNAVILETIFTEVFGQPLRYTVILGKGALQVIGSAHLNVSGATDNDTLVRAAQEAFL